MPLITQITSKLLVTLFTNDTVKEVAEAVALMELEETLSNMCSDGI